MVIFAVIITVNIHDDVCTANRILKFIFPIIYEITKLHLFYYYILLKDIKNLIKMSLIIIINLFIFE